jgi:quercetin dioxygenase-like cupin family protein
MPHTALGNRNFTRLIGLSVACATALCVTAATTLSVADEKSTSPNLSVVTSGLTAMEFAKVPGVIFAHALADVPGKNLVIVALEFPPKPQKQVDPPGQCPGHRHPGSAYVYVTKGTMRQGVAGKPAQLVRAGEGFFEPPGELHTVSENASPTEPASAIAIHIVPDGAPILIPNDKCKH